MITSPSRRPNRGARRALALVAAGLAHVAGPARPGWRRALPRRRRRRKRAPTAQTVRGGAQERAGPCRAWGRRADGGACPRCRPWILRVAGGGGAADGGIYMGGRRCGSGRGILQSRGNRPQRAPAVVGSGGVQVRTQGWRLARPWWGELRRALQQSDLGGSELRQAMQQLGAAAGLGELHSWIDGKRVHNGVRRGSAASASAARLCGCAFGADS